MGETFSQDRSNLLLAPALGTGHMEELNEGQDSQLQGESPVTLWSLVRILRF
jgi:hypothetical protein